MTVKELVERTDLQICCGTTGLKREVKSGYTSDILSDVMGNANEGAVWITLQTHRNIVAVASLKKLAAIILVKGLQPSPATISDSESEGIPILSTKKGTFEITGELYSIGW